MSRSKALWSIYLSIGISYLGVGLVAPLISIVLSKHGANSFLVGLVGTTMFAAFTAASFPVGTIVDEFGPKPVLIAGLIIYGASILAFAFIDSIGLFFLVRAIEGVGAASISVATETMIGRLSEAHERARLMSYYALSVGLGWSAGPLAGASLFGINPQLPFVACSALSMLAAMLVAAFVQKTESEDHQISGMLRGLSTQILPPICAGALHGYLMSSLITLFPIYLGELGFKEVQMGSIITAVIVGTILSQLPIGRAADRFGKRAVLMVCTLALAAIFALMPSHPRWWFFISAGAVAGALGGSLYPIGLAMLGGLVPRERLGAANALFSLAFGIGSLTGPSISGLAMNHLGNKWLFYLPAALIASFAILLLMTKSARD